MNYQDEFDKLINNIKNTKNASNANGEDEKSSSSAVQPPQHEPSASSRAKGVDEDASYDEFRAQYFQEKSPTSAKEKAVETDSVSKQTRRTDANRPQENRQQPSARRSSPESSRAVPTEQSAPSSEHKKRNGSQRSSSRDETASQQKKQVPSAGKKKEGFFATIQNGWNRMNNRVKVITYVGSVLVVSLLLSIYMLGASSDYFGLNQEDREVQLEIPEGATLSQVTKLLKDNDIIDHSGLFSLYAGVKHAGDNIQSGYYTFNCNMSYSQIIQALRYGYVELEVVSGVTFTEGMTVMDIAQVLEDNRVCTKDSFLNALNNETFGYDFIDSIPASDTRYLKLEGYLFPDTYDFYVNENPVSVIKRFLNNFDAQVTAEMRAQAENMGMTLDEVITLASVIQAEAADTDQMYAISGIFHNRLNSDSLTMLQSDATRDYATNNISPYVTDNQAMLDAYNTYVCSGLPAGPICNPGIDAIRAALQPENNNYYYFVHDSEGNVYYASTYEKHLQNVEKARAVGDGTVGGTTTEG